MSSDTLRTRDVLCLPMAMAGFDSIGQKPEPVKAVYLDPFLTCLPMRQ